MVTHLTSHAYNRCGLVVQMLHTAWSVCLCVWHHRDPATSLGVFGEQTHMGPRNRVLHDMYTWRHLANINMKLLDFKSSNFTVIASMSAAFMSVLELCHWSVTCTPVNSDVLTLTLMSVDLKTSSCTSHLQDEHVFIISVVF